MYSPNKLKIEVVPFIMECLIRFLTLIWIFLSYLSTCFCFCRLFFFTSKLITFHFSSVSITSRPAINTAPLPPSYYFSFTFFAPFTRAPKHEETACLFFFLTFQTSRVIFIIAKNKIPFCFTTSKYEGKKQIHRNKNKKKVKKRRK